MRESRGIFIVIEGGEGAGKTSQIEELKKQSGDGVVFTREPGGSPFAEIIRQLILSEQAKEADAKTHFALFWAARADHMKNTVIPALNSGKHVICSRFDSSSYVYQIYGQQDPELRDLFFQTRDIYLGNYKPDLYLFLDVSPEVGLKRKNIQKSEALDHFEERDRAFHERVRSGLRDFFEHVNHCQIDANRSFELVHQDLVATLQKHGVSSS